MPDAIPTSECSSGLGPPATPRSAPPKQTQTRRLRRECKGEQAEALLRALAEMVNAISAICPAMMRALEGYAVGRILDGCSIPKLDVTFRPLLPRIHGPSDEAEEGG